MSLNKWGIGDDSRGPGDRLKPGYKLASLISAEEEVSSQSCSGLLTSQQLHVHQCRIIRKYSILSSEKKSKQVLIPEWLGVVVRTSRNQKAIGREEERGKFLFARVLYPWSPATGKEWVRPNLLDQRNWPFSQLHSPGSAPGSLSLTWEDSWASTAASFSSPSPMAKASELLDTKNDSY